MCIIKNNQFLKNLVNTYVIELFLGLYKMLRKWFSLALIKCTRVPNKYTQPVEADPKSCTQLRERRYIGIIILNHKEVYPKKS